MRLSYMRFGVLFVAIVFLLHFTGCKSDDGGQVLSGVLMGIGQGLSGL